MGARDDLAALAGFVARQGITPLIDGVHPLRDTGRAMSRLISGTQFGKLVMTP